MAVDNNSQDSSSNSDDDDVAILDPSTVVEIQAEANSDRVITTAAGAHNRPKLIIGLGASAGGLQPLEDFFRAADPEAGHAYVVVQHLSPDFKSLMSELLSRQTSMPVYRVEDGMRVQANSVYLIPPRTDLTINGETLHLADHSVSQATGAHFPIDVFFRSLAQSSGNKSIGIILSGTGSDGSRGIRAIDEAGGLVLVQDPATAQFDGMPNAARVTGTPLQLLPPDELALLVNGLMSEHGPRHLPVESATPLSKMEEILALISAEVDNNFSAYKLKTLSRRVQRRRLITGVETLQDYNDLLEESRDERKLLAADLLIQVTNFFRDEAAWNYLRDKALPQLIASIPEEDQLRIWVSACSTGEEAYTMAMVAREALEDAGRTSQTLKIFATDVDPEVLTRAAAGIYPQSIVADVPSEMLKKYFSADGDNYVASRRLREMIIFAPHNMLFDAPFTRTHLVSCRNALIYLQPEAQTRVISMMHFSLIPNGVLFLGASETIGSLESEFKTLDRQWCIFTKIRDSRVPIESNFRTRNIEPAVNKKWRTSRTPTTRVSTTESITREVLQAIATERSWVCLVCDGHHNVMHTLGNSTKYLRIPQGDLTPEASRLVPDRLAMPLRASLHRAQRERKTINHNGISCEELESPVDLQVIYRPTTRATPEMYIVVLSTAEARLTTDADPDDSSLANVTSQQMTDLEYELHQTRENLQETIEELETTNEEQQATNEQLTAANEELQSTNEELHSVNEELYTVNAEYQQKITELTEVTNDIDNLLESTDIGVVFLDNSLKIRKFTPAATRDVHLMSADIGRPFDDLSYNFDYPELNSDLRRVLSLGEAIEREVESNQSDFLLVRIHPYRAGSELTVGIVVTFVNISELKRVEDALAQVETRYRHLFQSEMFGIILGNLYERKIIDANESYLNLLQLSRTDLPLSQQSVYADSEQEKLERTMRELEISGTTAPAPVLLKKADDTFVPVIIGQTLISESEGTYVGFVLATEELSDQAGLRLQEKAHELENVRNNLQQFAYISSHQLQEPLRAVTGFTQLLSDGYQKQLDEKGLAYIDSIKNGATQLSGIVEDLLLFSRVHTHAGPMEWFDLGKVVTKVLKQLSPEIKESNAKITTANLPEIYAESAQIKQLFTSLLQNAIKFRSERVPEVKISSRQVDNYWEFSIKDNGIGIASQNHERVFVMFQQLDSKDASATRGIGLAICQRIVERHYGNIWIESEPSVGTTIHFRLPHRQHQA